MPTTMQTAQLKLLQILECSAVDLPANNSDGWIVLKRAERRMMKAVAEKIAAPGDAREGPPPSPSRANFSKLREVDLLMFGSVDVAKQHHSAAQHRSTDGRFRQSMFRRATGKPVLQGARFFS